MQHAASRATGMSKENREYHGDGRSSPLSLEVPAARQRKVDASGL
jgi:hypothetical protein